MPLWICPSSRVILKRKPGLAGFSSNALFFSFSEQAHNSYIKLTCTAGAVLMFGLAQHSSLTQVLQPLSFSAVIRKQPTTADEKSESI